MESPLKIRPPGKVLLIGVLLVVAATFLACRGRTRTNVDPTPSATVASEPTADPSPSPSPSPPSDPTIAAAGDIACSPNDRAYNNGSGTDRACRHRYTSDLVVGLGVDAVLPLGDLQYENGEHENFLASYEPTWGRVKAITRPAPGNHDYREGNAAGYFAYWGPAAGDPAKGYYSYDLGAWHLIALNSNCSNVGGCGPESPQYAWLVADLAANPKTCTLAYWHHPRFSSGSAHGNTPRMEPFWQALYDANADVVLSGHDHLYERFGPQTANGTGDASRGIRQFTVGTGGASFYGFGAPQPNSEVRDTGTAGVLKMTLRPDSYTWEFVPEKGKSFTDSGTGACH